MDYARTNPYVRLLLVGQALALSFFTLVIPIEVIYAKESLGTTSAGYAVLISSWGAGILGGSLLYVRVKHRSGFVLAVVSSIAIGGAYLGLAAAGSLALACAISVIGGLGNGVQWIAVVTALQEQTPLDYQARITGLLESIGAAIPGVGFVLGGAVVALSSPRAAYAIAGAGVLALVVVALALRTRIESHASTAPVTPGAPNGTRADGFPATPTLETSAPET